MGKREYEVFRIPFSKLFFLPSPLREGKRGDLEADEQTNVLYLPFGKTEYRYPQR